jgi:transcriptional pleiotropic regulator of transition state genes
MKSTGIVRRVDELERIVIPIELRNKLKIAEKDPIEIYVEGSSIILKKYEETYVLCWTGYRLEKILAKPPRILSELRNLTDIKTTANVIRASPETQFLSLPGSGTSQLQEYMHPLVAGVTLRSASTLKFGDRLLCPMESEFLLLRDLPDIEKASKVYTTQVEATKHHIIPDDEYYYGYTIKIPDYGNLLLSSGIFVAT